MTLFKKNKGNWKLFKGSWSEASKKVGNGYDDKLLISAPEPLNPTRHAVILNLLRVKQQLKKDKIKVLDFGGGTGSLYLSALEFFDKSELDWNIIETDAVLNYAKTNNKLDIGFFTDLSEIDGECDVIISSAAIQYVAHPENLIREMINVIKPNYFLFDRTIFYKKTFLTIQHNVSEKYKDLKYPCWILDKKKIYNILEKNYSLEEESFSSTDRHDNVAGKRAEITGCLWSRV